MVMGPLMSSALLLVMLAVFPALPKISPPNLVTELNDSLKTYGLVKLVPFGSTPSTPGPTMLLDVKLGASLRKVKVPALMVVTPVYVLFPESVCVPVPALVKLSNVVLEFTNVPLKVAVPLSLPKDKVSEAGDPCESTLPVPLNAPILITVLLKA